MVEQTNVTGITTNPFKIIQATDKIGKDAQTVENSDASFGTLAQVFGPNQVIMDTGYFSANEFIGPHHIDVRWYNSINSGTGLVFEYWRKDESGLETLVQSANIDWHDDISDEFGASAGKAYFLPNTECRFIIKSHYSVTTSQWVAVDFIKITIMDMFAANVDNLVSSNGMPSYLHIDSGILSGAVSGSPSSGTIIVSVTTGWNPLNAVINTTVYGDPNYYAIISDRSSTTFTIYMMRRDNTTVNGTVYVAWTAFITDYYIPL